jgi:hypothetical protein
MFTPDQKTRMQTALSTPGCAFRYSLSSSAASLCINPVAAPVALIGMDTPVCDSLVVFTPTNNTTGNPIPAYSWSVSPSTGVTFSPSNTAATPSISFPAADFYTVTLTATNSQGSSTSSVVVEVYACYVGIKKYSPLNDHISLQPNPTSGKVNIIVGQLQTKSLEVTVTNALGQEVLSTKYSGAGSESLSLDMGPYSNGIYFVSISNGEEKVVKRLILSK